MTFVFQDGEGMREKLSDWESGLRPSAQAVNATDRKPRIRLMQSPDGHGQVFALNALLKEPDERTVIVLPSAETLFPVQRHCLSRFDRESYNISLGYPLVRTPVYGFLNDLMELIGSMDGERVYVPAISHLHAASLHQERAVRGSAAATRVLLHAMEEA